MADDHEDDNVVPFPRFEVTLEEDTLAQADVKTGLSYLMENYDYVVVVGWDEEEGRMDIIENGGDPAALYELLQQAAANVALDAIEESLRPTRH